MRPEQFSYRNVLWRGNVSNTTNSWSGVHTDSDGNTVLNLVRHVQVLNGVNECEGAVNDIAGIVLDVTVVVVYTSSNTEAIT